MKINPNGFAIPRGHLRALGQHLREKPGTWHILSAIPAEGTYGLMSEDADGNRVVCNIVLDVAPNLDANVEAYNSNLNRRWGDGQRIASIPMAIRFDKTALNGLGQAMEEGDRKHVRKVLNDPDYRKFRTFPGRL